MRHADWCHRQFGSKRHKYCLNQVISEATVREFEEKYAIRLPDDYRWFITKVGNGGAGPDYGLERFEHGIFACLDFDNEEEYIDPSKPFELTEPWNMPYDASLDDDEREKYEDEYFSDKWVNGVLRICNRGCGMSVLLVVNGPEHGTLWVDDRCSDYGIYPIDKRRKTYFWDWYGGWLNRVSESYRVPAWMFWYRNEPDK